MPFVLTTLVAATLFSGGPETGYRYTHAEPHLSVRTGLKCSACHVNRTGGGARTEFGSIYGQTQLPMTIEGFEVRRRWLNDWVAIGADVRVQGIANITDATPRTALDLREGAVMVEARLLRERLAVYIDQTVGPGRATARELFGIIESLPLNGYAKVGKFYLPYGLRIVDDREFIRDITGFNFLTPDQGIELGIEPGEFAVSVSVTNGNDGAAEGDDGKQVTGSGMWVTQDFRLGASASRNSGGSSVRKVYGGFGGFRAGPVAVLGEVDRISDGSATEADRNQLVAYAEGNVLVRQGINAKVTYGYHDRNTDVAEDQRVRMRFGLEVFPIPFLQASAFYTLFDDIPQALAQQDQISLELHFFF